MLLGADILSQAQPGRPERRFFTENFRGRSWTASKYVSALDTRLTYMLSFFPAIVVMFRGKRVKNG